MALRFDRNVRRFRDERGNFVTRTRGLKSSTARRQYRRARRTPTPTGFIAPADAVVTAAIGELPTDDQSFVEHDFDQGVFDDAGIDDDGEDSYSNDEN